MALREVTSRVAGLLAAVTALSAAFPAAGSAASGSIAGTVTEALGGAPVGDVEVCAHPVAAETRLGAAEAVACARTAADGTYLVAVPAGTYKIRFSPSQARLPRLFYGGKAINVEAEPVEVAEGEAVEGIDVEPAPAGRLEGTVTRVVEGTPIEGVEACAYLSRFGAERVGCDLADAAGRYAIGQLPEAEYKVEFRVVGILFNLAPQMYGHRYTWEGGEAVALAAGSAVAGLDAALDPGAEVSGEVEAAAGGPVEGTRVCAYWEEDDLKWACTHTDVLGRYRLWKLPPKTYRVGFSIEYDVRTEPQVPEVDGYQDQFSGLASSLDEAEAFPLGIGGGVDGVDARLLRSEEPLVPPVLPSRPEPVPAS